MSSVIDARLPQKRLDFSWNWERMLNCYSNSLLIGKTVDRRFERDLNFDYSYFQLTQL